MATKRRLAIVTGASSGIGAATARRLGGEGDRVVLVARNHSALAELASEIGDQAVVEALDAGDGDAVIAMAARVSERFGVPDLVVNSAGAGSWKWIEHTEPAEAKAMMQAPYLAAFNMCHAFVGDMLARGSGVLVHVNSPVSFATWPGCTGYAAARWALRGLHEALCDDLWRTGVRSCQVIFGEVASPYFEHNPGTRERVPGIARTIRTLTPEECARVIARVARQPRRLVIHPFMLRLYYWSHAVNPWATRFLLRRTGARRQARADSPSPADRD